MKYQGIGQLDFKAKSLRALVNLDPDRGCIVAKFPMESDKFAMDIYGDSELFEKKYSIRDLKIELPHGSISNKKLPNLFIKSINPGTMSIYDSFLVRSFNLHDKEIGISTIILFPSLSLLNFRYEGISSNNSSELVFNDTKIRSTVPHFSLTLSSERYLLSCENKILIVRADLNLLPKQRRFYRILSLLQGGRVTYRTGFYKKNLQINFVESKKINHLGQIFKEDTDKKEFVEKIWAYEDKLDKQGKNKHELFVEYFLEGMSANTNLENRIISLYTAIEIIDASKTLNKQSISSTFDIELNIADILVRFRNKIIHQGYTGNEALSESIKEVKTRTSLKRTPFKTSGRNKTTALFNYYLFLVICLYKRLFRDAGVVAKDIQYNDLIK